MKPNPVQILFVSFNENEDECRYCGNQYTETSNKRQKYCKNCFLEYVEHIKDTNNNKYLKITIKVTGCDECGYSYSSFIFIVFESGVIFVPKYGVFMK